MHIIIWKEEIKRNVSFPFPFYKCLLHAGKAAATILAEHPSDGGPVEDPYYSLPSSSQGANRTTPAKNESQLYKAIDITRVDYISVYSVPNKLKNKT